MDKPISVCEGFGNFFPGTRVAILAFAVSLMGCIAPQVSTTQSTKNPFSSEQIEGKDTIDIDNPVFIALVGISAEIQAAMECKENRSLQFVWETVSTRLQEMNLKHDVSTSLCPLQPTERGFAYIFIDVAGQQTQIFAKDVETAEKITIDIQTSCATYIGGRVKFLLGDAPATKEKLHIILQDEEKVLAKHLMTAIVEQKDNRTWTISFAADAS